MIVQKLSIEKFRGFSQIEFELGQNLTVIAGQNGTQKTTLLGLISQPFTINESTNPMKVEKPLSGGSYKSGFSDKFKLSPNFDKAKQHEWTLEVKGETEAFVIESINRDKSRGNIRFWQKGDRSKGSGYLQYPVIYLSLHRLFPIGEDKNVNEESDYEFTESDISFLNEWYKKILLIPDLQINKFYGLNSSQKKTLGITTDLYDWRSNSAGQDNLGKILLAILSFKNLSEKYKNNYKGGLLVIDEIDVTLYPASQLKLLELLRKSSSKYKIQIIFSTHSLTLLEACYNHSIDLKLKDQIRLVYLKREDDFIKIKENFSIEDIKDDLHVTLSRIGKKTNKIALFTEDKECEIFLKGLIKRNRASLLDFVQCTMGCDSYLELIKRKVKGFNFPESIICFDGDVKLENKKLKQINTFKNTIILPGSLSPERVLANMLNKEKDSSKIWNEIQSRYTKQICFKDYTIEEILKDRYKAKDWFKSQMIYWGNGCSKIINIWISKNSDEYNIFLQKLDSILEKYKEKINLE
jgi:predicted ATPase